MRSGTFLVDWLMRELFAVAPRRRRRFHARSRRRPRRARSAPAGWSSLPYWQGCMTPHWDSMRRAACIAGLSGSSRRGDIYRALLEGVAL